MGFTTATKRIGDLHEAIIQPTRACRSGLCDQPGIDKMSGVNYFHLSAHMDLQDHPIPHMILLLVQNEEPRVDLLHTVIQRFPQW